jgi:hypothetical protein
MIAWRLAAASATALCLLLQGCAVSRTVEYEDVDLQTAVAEVPQQALLDIGIMIFDPGIPESIEKQEKDMIFPEVRRAEARYMPYHLKGTLERTGYWGSVWVIPEASDAMDLLVWGRVEQSDGYNVKLRVGAWDASGREWLNKEYQTQVPAKAYSQYRDPAQDPYQNVYNEIANDLLAAREKLATEELVRIREIANLRYAADLVPDAFSGYLQKGKNDTYEIVRLPAEGDPMMARLDAVREREYTLVDSLNEYYAGLYYDLSVPYEDWRKVSREESLRYQEVKRSARLRQLLGAAAILGAIAYEGSGGSNSAITMTGVIAGVEGLKSGFGLSTEADLHKDSIRELGQSFDAEAQPLVVEVEGQTRRLTGSAEQKYQEWRRILREIYATETGGVLSADLPQPGVDDAPVPALSRD